MVNLKSSSGSAGRPNFVFILGDDVGYGSITSDITPFMAGLQKKSVVLENYYSQETCTPARAALLTGRYPLTIGVQFYEQEAANRGGLPEGETTLADVLQTEGYTTYMMGKWNLGNASPDQLPTARGFDYYLGFLDAYNHYWTKQNPDFPDYKDFLYADGQCYYTYDGDDLETYSTEMFQNAAVAAVAGHDFDESPMFMYLALQGMPFGPPGNDPSTPSRLTNPPRPCSCTWRFQPRARRLTTTTRTTRRGWTMRTSSPLGKGTSGSIFRTQWTATCNSRFVVGHRLPLHPA